MDSWTWMAASCRGTTHVRDGTRKQDAMATFAEQEGGVLVAIACDGAGSASHGRVGAMMATVTLARRARAWLRDYLIGREWIVRGPDENFDDFRNRARGEINRGDYWRPQRFDGTENDHKYGQPRENPWHPNLDDIMFYL